ncbi:MAG: hypothetical protein ACC726_08060 [Chloroflexota bacterium]
MVRRSQSFVLDELLLATVSDAPWSEFGNWPGAWPGAHLRARGLLVEAKMADLRRRHGPPRGGGGGCRSGCLIIAIPIVAIFIIGLVLTLATRLG